MRKPCIVAAILSLVAGAGIAQQLEPRAYSISPVGVNIAVLDASRSTGDLSFDPTLPIEDASATLKTVAAGYFRSLDVFGRSGSVGMVVPYVWGPLEGRVSGIPQSIRRSGLGDAAVRFAANLYGAPAMDLKQFTEYRERTTLGASVILVVPVGQYDPSKLINIGSNRWAIKPEVGLSQGLGRWYVDLYAGVWIFGANPDFLGKTRTQNPIGTSQFHLSYNFRPRLWAAFDANYYVGGRISVNGIPTATLQRNSRIGGTVSFPLTKHNSMKVTVSTGAITTIGAAFTTVSVAYQRIWGAGL